MTAPNASRHSAAVVRIRCSSGGATRRPADGEVVIREGVMIDRLFVVLSGALGVTLANGETVATLGAGEVVGEIAKSIGKSSAQVALAWTLLNPAVTAPVIGVRTVAQLKDNLGALDVTISADQLARLDALSGVPKVFPMDILTSPAEGMMFGNVKVQHRA